MAMSSLLSFFPYGLRIVVVDSDEASLNDTVQKLQEVKHYTVTGCSSASSALKTLYRARGSFDLLLTEIRLADMDGRSLLQHVRQNFDLPVFVMSAVQTAELVAECINFRHLFKPLERYHVLADIWKYVARARTSPLVHTVGDRTWETASHVATAETSTSRMLLPAAAEEEHRAREEETGLEAHAHRRTAEKDDMAFDGNGEGEQALGDSGDGRNISSGPKERNNVSCSVNKHVGDGRGKKALCVGSSRDCRKAKTLWTDELHLLFLEAINKLGVNEACPSKLLPLMNRPELTRKQVASHLQKHRQHLKRKLYGKELANIETSSLLKGDKKSSVSGSVLNKPMVERTMNELMEMMPKVVSSMSSTTGATELSSQHISSSALISELMLTTKPATYMGFLLIPPCPEYQQQGPAGLQGSSSMASSSSSGMEHSFRQYMSDHPEEQTPGFSTKLATGNNENNQAVGTCNLMNLHESESMSNDAASTMFLTGESSLGMAGICEQKSHQVADPVGNTTGNYLSNLQLEPTIGQQGFHQEGSMHAINELFSQDVSSELNAEIDYDSIIEQFIQDDHVPSSVFEKIEANNVPEISLEFQASPQQNFRQNDTSNFTDRYIKETPIETMIPLGNEQKSGISCNKFHEIQTIQFDSRNEQENGISCNDFHEIQTIQFDSRILSDNDFNGIWFDSRNEQQKLYSGVSGIQFNPGNEQQNGILPCEYLNGLQLDSRNKQRNEILRCNDSNETQFASRNEQQNEILPCNDSNGIQFNSGNEQQNEILPCNDLNILQFNSGNEQQNEILSCNDLNRIQFNSGNEQQNEILPCNGLSGMQFNSGNVQQIEMLPCFSEIQFNSENEQQNEILSCSDLSIIQLDSGNENQNGILSCSDFSTIQFGLENEHHNGILSCNDFGGVQSDLGNEQQNGILSGSDISGTLFGSRKQKKNEISCSIFSGMQFDLENEQKNEISYNDFGRTHNSENMQQNRISCNDISETQSDSGNEKQNGIPYAEFSGIKFDSEDYIPFANNSNLIIEQEDDVDNALDNIIANFIATMDEAKQGENQKTEH